VEHLTACTERRFSRPVVIMIGSASWREKEDEVSDSAFMWQGNALVVLDWERLAGVIL
jgi:hypothetical protein